MYVWHVLKQQGAAVLENQEDKFSAKENFRNVQEWISKYNEYL